MKYEKPIVRDLTARAASGGPPMPLYTCGVGEAPSADCLPAGLNFGDLCITGGTEQLQLCMSGVDPEIR